MKTLVATALFFLVSPIAFSAKLLDKTIAIFNEQVITLSQVERIKSNLDARRNIAPQIYDAPSYSDMELARIRLQRYLVRAKLAALNIVIGDDQVETQIDANNQRLGINREVLLKFLSQNNFTYDEYFQLIKESIENNYFIGQVIQPLISITDQEVRNEYTKEGNKGSAKIFKYDLIDYKIKKSDATVKNIKSFQDAILSFRKNGKAPDPFSNLETQNMDDIRGDGVNKTLREVLKTTPTGQLTKPILLGQTFHIFYIKSKGEDSSEDFESAKNRIRAELFNRSLGTVTKDWFESEARKHYIKFYI